MGNGTIRAESGAGRVNQLQRAGLNWSLTQRRFGAVEFTPWPEVDQTTIKARMRRWMAARSNPQDGHEPCLPEAAVEVHGDVE